LTVTWSAAQIPHMFRVYVILVRTGYLLAVLIVLTCITPSLAQFVRSTIQPAFIRRDWLVESLTGVVLVLLFLLPLRALARLVRRSELIPDSHLLERPVVAFLVWITSITGCALALLVAWALISTLPEPHHGNLAAPAMLAFMMFAFALLTGELVLVGRLVRASG
jgi:amino acid transporter